MVLLLGFRHFTSPLEALRLGFCILRMAREEERASRTCHFATDKKKERVLQYGMHPL